MPRTHSQIDMIRAELKWVNQLFVLLVGGIVWAVPALWFAPPR